MSLILLLKWKNSIYIFNETTEHLNYQNRSTQLETDSGKWIHLFREGTLKLKCKFMKWILVGNKKFYKSV